MECEFSVELGPDDPTLAVPWQSPDGSVRFADLRREPAQIDGLEEVQSFPELAPFLRALNRGSVATAKCDAWFDTLMDVDDEPYEAALKCGCYIDLFLTDEGRFALFADLEQRTRALVEAVRTSDDLPSRAVISLRRAWFEDREGFYWTVYVFGYGETEQAARMNWQAGLHVVQAALQLKLNS